MKRNQIRTIARAGLLGITLAGSFAVGEVGSAPTPMPAVPTLAQTDCSKVTDMDLVKAVYAKFRANEMLKNDINHINVSVKDSVIVLEGYAIDEYEPWGRRDVILAGRLARLVQCRKRVINKLKHYRSGSCDPPHKKVCGEDCIDANATCNLPPPPG